METEIVNETFQFSVVIPTVGSESLADCIRAVGTQSALPMEVIVVSDGGVADDIWRQVRRHLPEKVRVTVTENPGRPGSATTRNTGMRMATGDVVVFLDDDTTLGETYLERLRELYEKYDSEHLAGIGGVTANDAPERTRLERWFQRLFYLGDHGFEINAVGMSPVTCEREMPSTVDWLVGNNMSFKRDVIRAHPLPQWHEGREPLDDLGLGWSLKADGYHCVLAPDLPLEHGHDAASHVESLRRAARDQVLLFRQYGAPRHAPLFLWAMVGKSLGQFLGESELVVRDPREWFMRGFAYVSGFLSGLDPSARVRPRH